MKVSQLILAVIVTLFAQTVGTLKSQEKQLALQDLIPGGKNHYRFVPRDLKQLQWCGDYYFYVKGDSLYAALPMDALEKIVSSLEELNQLLTHKKLPVLSGLPSFTVPDPSKPILAFQYKNHWIHYHIEKKTIVADYLLAESWKNLEFCKSNGNLAFTEDNNVFIVDPTNKKYTVTEEVHPGIVSGTAVHQNEFGIDKGLFWSPEGSALAYYRMDEQVVTDYPLVNIGTRVAEAELFKYPMAGMKSHEVTIGVYRISDGRTVWLETGLPKEKFLTNIAWSPDEKSLYVAELNREQNECKLIRYSASTGKREAHLFTEYNEKYVEPQNPVLFLPHQPDRFIWQSQRDGYNHLYLYQTDGKLIKQLTKGRWIIKQVYGFDEKGEHLFFASTANPSLSLNKSSDGLEVFTWKLNLKTGKSICLHHQPGLHQAKFNYRGTYAIDQMMSPSVPRQIDLVDTKKSHSIKTLLSAKNPFEAYDMPIIKTGTVLASDGKTQLNYRLTIPAHIEETKKHPAIIYVYGGPHLQLVTGGWLNGASGWDVYMAQRGYIMLTLDNRGSSNRGFEFESVIHRQLGSCEMEDQLKGVELLKTLPYVDSMRIGVHGWSYGGFMTTNLMLSHPTIFKAGVAGGPVIDWKRYEIMYGERYMDHPKENSEGYKGSNLCEKASSLEGKLLIIHGDMDPVVVWQHSLLFLKACVDGGTFPDYFVYPGHKHNVLGKDRPHLYEKITRYFDEHL